MAKHSDETVQQQQAIQKEVDYYKGIIAKMPQSSTFSINAHIKLGKLYRHLGKTQTALEEYAVAARTYTDKGELVKALAVNKMMTELTSEYEKASEAVNSLYFQHGDNIKSKPQTFKTSLSDKEEHREEAEIASHLKQNPLFACLNWTERQWVEENVTLYHFAPNTTVLQKGHEQEALFVILEGYVKIVIREDDTPERVLAILGPQDFFGEISLLQAYQSRASAIAEHACSIIEMPKTVIAALIKKHPSIAGTLRQSSTRRTLDMILSEIPLFKHLDGEERQKIAGFLSPLSVKQGTTIVAEGDTGDCMYLIKNGEVGVYTSLMLEDETGSTTEARQQELHLATLQTGDFFGEQALITNERRNATVIALKDLQLLRFSKPDLEVIVQTYPRIADILKQYHHQRTTDTMESLHMAFQRMITGDSPALP
ncbi:hypothetical protein CSA56_06570 [candidate division KSB3 bacterium]|uniref:Cyclic nucleotide-binding domain-containing protein n=1 Tax=candidate division KSB3 bacterium TaxID=2044937 RepID=A0A2G6KGP4_9BACT|nr:MAG: hypothetical protein CSA56_06570 [candidate division KSB3 bacterium]